MLKSKICSRCKKNKTLDKFHKNSRRNHKDGRNTVCAECCREKEKQSVKKSKYVAKFRKCTTCKKVKPAKDFHKNKGKRGGLCEGCKDCRNRQIVEKRHGLENGGLKEMKEKCDYKCEICMKKLPLAVDHCHESGKIRGMLCINCNNGLGRFKDNVKYLKNAIKYLKENG